MENERLENTASLGGIKKRTTPKKVSEESGSLDRLFENKYVQPDTNSIEYQKAKDAEPIRGIFRNLETPGGTVKFTYYAYEGDPVTKYELTDEQIYTLPRGVARHLNTNTKYPVYHHSHSTNEMGIPIPTEQIGKMVSRYVFQPLDFADVGDTSITGGSDPRIIMPSWRY